MEQKDLHLAVEHLIERIEALERFQARATTMIAPPVLEDTVDTLAERLQAVQRTLERAVGSVKENLDRTGRDLEGRVCDLERQAR